jgi:hypothetical protein
LRLFHQVLHRLGRSWLRSICSRPNQSPHLEKKSAAPVDPIVGRLSSRFDHCKSKKKEEGNRAGRGLANARLPRSPTCGARDPPQRIGPIDLKLQLAAVGCSTGQVLRGPAHRPGSLASQQEEPALPTISQGLPRPALPGTEIVWGQASLVLPPTLAHFLCHSSRALDSLLGLFSL